MKKGNEKKFVFNDEHFEFEKDFSQGEFNKEEVNGDTFEVDFIVEKTTKEKAQTKTKAEKKKKSANKSTNVRSNGNHAGHRARMRKRFMENGLNGFSEHEVLEMILYNSNSRSNTNPVAHELIKKFSSLSNVLNADIKDLITVPGVAEVSAVNIKLFKEVADYIVTVKKPKNMLTTSKDIGMYCMNKYGGSDIEKLVLISLSKTRNIVGENIISTGDEFSTRVHTKEIVRCALANKATYVILCHNHPGGNVNPSSNDINITMDICTVMDSLQIPVIDHIICTGDAYTSFAERNLFIAGNGRYYS